MKKNEYNFTPLNSPVPIAKQIWPEGTPPLVHTRTMTYMHEKYISDCIEGILMQKTVFPVQIFIHDDASTDTTAEIIRKYEKKYPRLIKAYYQQENTFTKKDKHECRSEFNNWLTGKYEAICEGDDYWTDPLKLQKQVSFLEKNPDYGLCYTKAYYFMQKNKRLIKKEYGSNACTFEQLIYNGNSIPTLTTCFKKTLFNDYLSEIDPYSKNWNMGDYPLFLWFSLHSKIEFINDATGVYRMLQLSLSHSNSYEKEKKFKDSAENIIRYFLNVYNIQYNENKLSLRIAGEMASCAARYNKYAEFKEYAKKIKQLEHKFNKFALISSSRLIFFLYTLWLRKLKYHYFGILLNKIIKRLKI